MGKTRKDTSDKPYRGRFIDFLRMDEYKKKRGRLLDKIKRIKEEDVIG